MNSFILTLFVAVASLLVLSTALPASDLAESAPAPGTAAPRDARSPKDLATAESAGYGWGWGGYHHTPYVYSHHWGYPSYWNYGYDWPYYGYGWGHYGYGGYGGYGHYGHWW